MLLPTSCLILLALPFQDASPSRLPTPIDAMEFYPTRASYELGKDVFTLNTQAFAIPVTVAPNRGKDIKKMHLYQSENQGRTWRRIASIDVTEKTFSVRALRDGLYWFTLVVEYKNGRQEPADIRTAAVQPLKVRVHTALKKLP